MSEISTAVDLRQLQQIRTSISYPDVPFPVIRDWDVLPDDYTPTEYTAERVKRAVPDWQNPDLEAVWRRAVALFPDTHWRRDAKTGRLLNPAGATGVSGLGRLRILGPNLTGDGLVTYGDQVLLIERKDTGLLAFPGGFNEGQEGKLQV